MQRILFWQPIPSFHQSAMISALAQLEEVAVSLICEHPLDLERQKLGWPVSDFGQADVIIEPSEVEIHRLIEGSATDAVHIFSGIRAYPMVRKGFHRAKRRNLPIGLLAETADWNGFGGTLRWAVGRYDALRCRHHIGFVLAIGSLGVRWYRNLGFFQDRVFPFGYFLEQPDEVSSQLLVSDVWTCISSERVNIVFVGRCVRAKGVDLLLYALSRIDCSLWSLTVIGDGPEVPHLKVLCSKLSLLSNVHFVGALPHHVAMKNLETQHLLVLPSRSKDGWGAVVNEALMRGVPVICSDYCGAQDLLSEPWRGSVFPAGDTDALAQALEAEISRGPLSSERREAIKQWSRAISGEVAAQYLLDVISSVASGSARPIPPWL